MNFSAEVRHLGIKSPRKQGFQFKKCHYNNGLLNIRAITQEAVYPANNVMCSSSTFAILFNLISLMMFAYNSRMPVTIRCPNVMRMCTFSV